MATRKTKVDKKVATKSLSAEVTPTYDALVSTIESLVRDARTGLKAARTRFDGQIGARF